MHRDLVSVPLGRIAIVCISFVRVILAGLGMKPIFVFIENSRENETMARLDSHLVKKMEFHFKFPRKCTF